MKKNIPYDELARIIANRSTCSVRVGAVIYDRAGVFAWGWNNTGPDGFGQCAEDHAISRANRSRLNGASILIVSLRKRKQICSRPCWNCTIRIYAAGIVKVTYATSDGEWVCRRADRKNGQPSS